MPLRRVVLSVLQLSSMGAVSWKNEGEEGVYIYMQTYVNPKILMSARTGDLTPKKDHLLYMHWCLDPDWSISECVQSDDIVSQSQKMQFALQDALEERGRTLKGAASPPPHLPPSVPAGFYMLPDLKKSQFFFGPESKDLFVKPRMRTFPPFHPPSGESLTPSSGPVSVP